MMTVKTVSGLVDRFRTPGHQVDNRFVVPLHVSFFSI